MSRILDKNNEINARIDNKSLRDRAVVLTEDIDDPEILEEINDILKHAGCLPIDKLDGYVVGDFAKYLLHKAICANCRGLDCPVSGQVVRIMSINGKYSFSTVYCTRYYELSKGIDRKSETQKKRSKTTVLFDKRKRIRKTDTSRKEKQKQGFLW